MRDTFELLLVSLWSAWVLTCGLQSEVSADGTSQTLSEESVWRGGRCCPCEWGLVSEQIQHESVLEYHNKTCPPLTNSDSHTSSSIPPRKITLGFVTPWNEKGFEFAERYGRDHRLTHVSPVWYQIKYIKGSGITVMGSHWKRARWVRDMQDSGVRVVPRITIDPSGWDHHQLNRLLLKKKMHKRLVSRMAAVINAGGLDGCVFEFTPLLNFIIQQSNAARDPSKNIDEKTVRRSKSRLDALIKRVARHFSLRTKKNHNSDEDDHSDPGYHDFFVAVTPAHLTLVNYQEYGEWLNGIALMTYDYTVHTTREPGPNAPMQGFLVPYLSEAVVKEYQRMNPRVKSAMHKVLLGLNFYGYRFANDAQGRGMPAEAVTGQRDIIDGLVELEDQRGQWQWKWAEEHSEHYLVNTNNDQIWFPSLMSIDVRLRLAHQFGMGLSIWELGQGLEYFFHLF